MQRLLCVPDVPDASPGVLRHPALGKVHVPGQALELLEGLPQVALQDAVALGVVLSKGKIV